MSGIRALVREDIPRVVTLFRRAFPDVPKATDEDLAGYFERIFFDHPWYDQDLPSHVYEARDGSLAGFVGVTPRRMLFEGRPIRLAISSHYMVDSSSRGSLAGVELLKTFFRGPQDLALAEGNRASRRIWEGLGGMTSLLLSMNWASPLRPASFLLHQLSRSPLLAPARWACRGLDAILGFFGGPAAPAGASVEDLDEASLVGCVERFGADYRLRPVYDEESTRWLLDLLERKRKYGRLRKNLVRDASGGILGWFVWYENPGGVANVVQLGASPGTAAAVIASLFREARRVGSIGITGRMEPRFFSELAALVVFLSRTHTWMMLHARDSRLLHAIQDGDAFLSRMEGEWWIPYHET